MLFFRLGKRSSGVDRCVSVIWGLLCKLHETACVLKFFSSSLTRFRPSLNHYKALHVPCWLRKDSWLISICHFLLANIQHKLKLTDFAILPDPPSYPPPPPPSFMDTLRRKMGGGGSRNSTLSKKPDQVWGECWRRDYLMEKKTLFEENLAISGKQNLTRKGVNLILKSCRAESPKEV